MHNMKLIDMTQDNLKPDSSVLPDPLPQAWIGLDWGDKKHSFTLQERGGCPEAGTLVHSAENLHRWLHELEQRFQGRPVWLGIETSRGATITALLQYPWLQIYPINPLTSARYRSAFAPSGAKDDQPDSEVCLELVRDHAAKLRPLQPQDPQTLQLAGLVEVRRDMVDRRTTLLNQLTSLLKSYYPQALALLENLNTPMAVAFLKRWPDLLSLKAARLATIKSFFYQHNLRSPELVEKRLALIAQSVALTTEEARVSVAILHLRQLVDELAVFQEHVARLDTAIKTTFAQHAEAYLFRDLPGAGPQLAPRLCVAFGTDRSVYPEPASLQKYAGVAPVREKSGQQLWVHWRWNAPLFLRQSFVEWAGQTVRYSTWAGRYYHNMLKKGKKHAVIIRALAFKWIRILWKCWIDRTPYDEARYLKQLAHRKSCHALTAP
jgi:transposase